MIGSENERTVSLHSEWWPAVYSGLPAETRHLDVSGGTWAFGLHTPNFGIVPGPQPSDRVPGGSFPTLDHLFPRLSVLSPASHPERTFPLGSALLRGPEVVGLGAEMDLKVIRTLIPRPREEEAGGQGGREAELTQNKCVPQGVYAVARKMGNDSGQRRGKNKGIGCFPWSV